MSTTVNGTATSISPEAFAALTGPDAIQDLGAGGAGTTTLAEKLDAPQDEQKSFLKRHAGAIGGTAAGLAAIILAVWRGKAATADVAKALEAATQGGKGAGKAAREADKIGSFEKAGQWMKSFVGGSADFKKAESGASVAKGAATTEKATTEYQKAKQAADEAKTARAAAKKELKAATTKYNQASTKADKTATAAGKAKEAAKNEKTARAAAEKRIADLEQEIKEIRNAKPNAKVSPKATAATEAAPVEAPAAAANEAPKARAKKAK